MLNREPPSTTLPKVCIAKHRRKSCQIKEKVLEEEKPIEQKLEIEKPEEKKEEKNKDEKENLKINIEEKKEQPIAPESLKVKLNIIQAETKPVKKIFCRNEILYKFDWKEDKMKIFASRKEDKLFVYKEPKGEEKQKVQKLKTLKKIKNFRDFISKRLGE